MAANKVVIGGGVARRGGTWMMEEKMRILEGLSWNQ